MGYYDFQKFTVDIDNDGVMVKQLSVRKNKKNNEEHLFVNEFAYIPVRHITGIVLLPEYSKIKIYNVNSEMTTTIKIPTSDINVVMTDLLDIVKAA